MHEVARVELENHRARDNDEPAKRFDWVPSRSGCFLNQRRTKNQGVALYSLLLLLLLLVNSFTIPNTNKNINVRNIKHKPKNEADRIITTTITV